MIRIKRFNELFEAIAVHKDMRAERLPHCSEMQARGYRTAQINGEWFAFQKNFDLDDDIYWLGEDELDYKYGEKYVADEITSKKNLPFYSIYCKCDSSLTDEERKRVVERDKEIAKKREQDKREREARQKAKQKKKKGR